MDWPSVPSLTFPGILFGTWWPTEDYPPPRPDARRRCRDAQLFISKCKHTSGYQCIWPGCELQRSEVFHCYPSVTKK